MVRGLKAERGQARRGGRSSRLIERVGDAGRQRRAPPQPADARNIRQAEPWPGALSQSGKRVTPGPRDSDSLELSAHERSATTRRTTDVESPRRLQCPAGGPPPRPVPLFLASTESTSRHLMRCGEEHEILPAPAASDRHDQPLLRSSARRRCGRQPEEKHRGSAACAVMRLRALSKDGRAFRSL